MWPYLGVVTSSWQGLAALAALAALAMELPAAGSFESESPISTRQVVSLFALWGVDVVLWHGAAGARRRKETT